MIGKRWRAAYKSGGEIWQVPVEDIRPNPDQPRREFSRESLLELAQSISENGVLNPLSITMEDGTPTLIAGERRLRAAKIAGLRSVPCIVVQAAGEQRALLALLENLQRENMNCFETAEGIRRLIQCYGLTQEEAADRLGCAQSTIANRLRLLRFSDGERQRMLEAGLTERHARALLACRDERTRAKLLERAATQQLTVAQTERLVAETLHSEEHPHTRSAERRGLPVVRDVRIFCNTLNHAVETMQRSGIAARADKSETAEYIEYVVRIPKLLTEIKKSG